MPRIRVPRHVARLVVWLVVDYFAYAVRPGASARCSSSTTSPTPRVRVPRYVARLAVDYFSYAARPSASARRAARRTARRRLLRLRRASGCLGTSYGVGARLVAPLVVDYFAYAARPGASARRVACRRLLRAPRLRLADTLALLQPRHASRLLASRQHWFYFEYVAHRCDVIFRSHRVDHSSRLVFQIGREWQSRPRQLVGINSD
jgi:hypothetical protein